MMQKPDPQLVEGIMEWLMTLHATTWGGTGWTVTKEDTRREAANWFATQMETYHCWAVDNDDQ